MKNGMRKPSTKKRISARTSIKRQIVHRSGIKMPRGYGWLKSELALNRLCKDSDIQMMKSHGKFIYILLNQKEKRLLKSSAN
jgi:hypothetical protein